MLNTQRFVAAAVPQFNSRTDCTELSLGGRGLEQLSGFERLVNLEALYVNDNRLRCITGLEHNVRIKQLYVHNNRLCTLKGSLTRLKFLTHLDVSHNQLKGLGKVLATLQKLHFLQELNLQVCSTQDNNRCCVFMPAVALVCKQHHASLL